MASLVQGPSATGGGLPGVPCHRGTSATLGFISYVELFWFWAGLILVFFCKMCAAFAVGKLHFSHVCCICACVLHCVLCGMLVCLCFGNVWFLFWFRMCAAFGLGTLHFWHVLGRCVGHILFMLLLICFCDLFVIARPPPLGEGPSAT